MTNWIIVCIINVLNQEVAVLWLAELASNQKILDSIPATSIFSEGPAVVKFVRCQPKKNGRKNTLAT